MARYTGADCRLCRREGAKLFLKGDRCYTDKCAIERRNWVIEQMVENDYISREEAEKAKAEQAEKQAESQDSKK